MEMTNAVRAVYDNNHDHEPTNPETMNACGVSSEIKDQEHLAMPKVFVLEHSLANLPYFQDKE